MKNRRNIIIIVCITVLVGVIGLSVGAANQYYPFTPSEPEKTTKTVEEVVSERIKKTEKENQEKFLNMSEEELKAYKEWEMNLTKEDKKEIEEQKAAEERVQFLKEKALAEEELKTLSKEAEELERKGAADDWSENDRIRYINVKDTIMHLEEYYFSEPPTADEALVSRIRSLRDEDALKMYEDGLANAKTNEEIEIYTENIKRVNRYMQLADEVEKRYKNGENSAELLEYIAKTVEYIIETSIHTY